jgi:HEAT repeat protein
MGKIYDSAQKTTSTTKNLSWLEKGVIKSRESIELIKKIEIGEHRLNKLYRELGRKNVESTDLNNPSASEEVQSLLTDIKELKSKIDQLKERVVELEKRKMADLLLKKELKDYARRSGKTTRRYRKDEPKIHEAVRHAIADALEHDNFASGSDRVTFQTVASDLLDHEMEIKILAAAELGKMKCVAAIDVLKEALNFDDPRLTLEIISSLATIGNHKTLSVFFENLTNPYHRVRIEALTAFCKWAEDKDEVLLSLLKALKDQHPEVRVIAVTLLGWKKEFDTMPALFACLNDRDESVRKAVVSALANIGDRAALPALVGLLGDSNREIRKKALDTIKEISGEDIAFDLQAERKELSNAIKDVAEALRVKADVFEKEPPVEIEETAAPEKDIPETSVERDVVSESEEPEPEPLSVPVFEKTAEEVKEAGREDIAEELKVKIDVSEVEEPTAETEEKAVSEKEITETSVKEKVVIEVMSPKAEPVSAPFKKAKLETISSKKTNAVKPSRTPKTKFNKGQLKKMVKPQLLSLCKDLNVECDYTDTKDQIITKMLES